MKNIEIDKHGGSTAERLEVIREAFNHLCIVFTFTEDEFIGELRADYARDGSVEFTANTPFKGREIPILIKIGELRPLRKGRKQ